jgi:[acyl-carrier-protein] S-malonyltransferase
MEMAAERLEGGMLAVIGLEPENSASLVEQAASLNVVLANDNAPGQWVLSGPLKALEELAQQVTRKRLGRCVKLAVRGAWHHPLMATAQTAFAQWLAGVPFKAPKIPIVLNTTASAATDPELIKTQLLANLTRPVRWQESMQTLHHHRCTRLFEIGPGRILSGLARANGFANTISIHCVNNLRGVAMAANGVPTS